MTTPRRAAGETRRGGAGTPFRRVCVYCGSSAGADPAYRAAAEELGAFLAARGIGVVFGGGRVGLMGALADAALAAGGEVLGVIPDRLRDRELDHQGLTELFVVDSMHARKMLMAQLSDAFIGLPGGWGTLEEVFEVTTWTQLRYHRKPIGLLNVAGYFDGLLAFLDHAAGEGFIRAPHRDLLQAETSCEALLQRLATTDLPPLERWIDRP